MRTLLLLLIGLSVLLSGCVTTETSPTDRGVAPLTYIPGDPVEEQRVRGVAVKVFLVGLLCLGLTALVLASW